MSAQSPSDPINAEPPDDTLTAESPGDPMIAESPGDSMNTCFLDSGLYTPEVVLLRVNMI